MLPDLTRTAPRPGVAVAASANLPAVVEKGEQTLPLPVSETSDFEVEVSEEAAGPKLDPHWVKYLNTAQAQAEREAQLQVERRQAAVAKVDKLCAPIVEAAFQKLLAAGPGVSTKVFSHAVKRATVNGRTTRKPYHAKFLSRHTRSLTSFHKKLLRDKDIRGTGVVPYHSLLPVLLPMLAAKLTGPGSPLTAAFTEKEKDFGAERCLYDQWLAVSLTVKPEYAEKWNKLG